MHCLLDHVRLMSTPGLGGGLGSLPTNWIQFHEFRGASLRSAEINVRRQTRDSKHHGCGQEQHSFETDNIDTDLMLLSSNSSLYYVLIYVNSLSEQSL